MKARPHRGDQFRHHDASGMLRIPRANSSPKPLNAPVARTHELSFAVMLFTGLISFGNDVPVATVQLNITRMRFSRVSESPQQYPHRLRG